MALFNNQTKQEKEEQKAQKIMDKFGLNYLTQSDYESCKRIINDMAGLGLMKTGMALSFANSADQCTVGYLSAMVEQNWIMIRQLNEVNQRLEWIMSKMEE